MYVVYQQYTITLVTSEVLQAGSPVVPGSAQNGPGDAKTEAVSHVDAVLPVLAMQEYGPYVAIGLGTQLLLHDRRSKCMHPLQGML